MTFTKEIPYKKNGLNREKTHFFRFFGFYSPKRGKKFFFYFSGLQNNISKHVTQKLI